MYTDICLAYVIRRDLVQMKGMKFVVSGGAVYIFHIEYKYVAANLHLERLSLSFSVTTL
jgi:hypothetical protein